MIALRWKQTNTNVHLQNEMRSWWLIRFIVFFSLIFPPHLCLSVTLSIFLLLFDFVLLRLVFTIWKMIHLFDSNYTYVVMFHDDKWFPLYEKCITCTVCALVHQKNAFPYKMDGGVDAMVETVCCKTILFHHIFTILNKYVTWFTKFHEFTMWRWMCTMWASKGSKAEMPRKKNTVSQENRLMVRNWKMYEIVASCC